MERVRSGIKGLDELVNGGFPKGSLVLLTGSCGTGKTTFCAQFLHSGATQYGENGVYVSFEESPESIRSNMLQFGLDFSQLEAEKKVVFVKYDPYHIEDIFDIIESTVRSIGASRVCVDSISALGLYIRDMAELRRMVYNLGMVLRKLRCTSIIVSEIPQGVSGLSRFGIEEFITDGVLVLYYNKIDSTFTRSITVLKMRGSDHSKRLHPYTVTSEGIIVYNTEEAFTK